MTAREIAAALRAAHRSGAWWRCRCPVHCSRGPTLALRDGERGGLIVKCFGGCDAPDVLAELRRLGLISDGARDRPHRLPGTTRPDERDDAARRLAMAQRIWNSAHDARGSPVVRYLASRGITIAPPPMLRYTPALRRPDGSYGPAMVARIDSIDGDLIGITRTWLARDSAGSWRRHDRAMLGRATSGAVRLAPAAKALLIGEGLETCLSAVQASGMPAWAALSTSGLVGLILPPIVRHVIVLADNDRSGAGERAAYAAAQGWIAEGRAVRIAMPPKPGSDFNDVLIGPAYAEMRDVAA